VLQKFFGLAIIAMNICVLSQALAESATQPAKVLVNADKSGLAIQGYDPVAYFTDSKALLGDSKITSSYHGAIYRFASMDHKTMFDADPAKYEPQFGGYCAYGTSKNKLVPITPEAFNIVDGRLLLQYDLGVREKFNKDVSGNLRKADSNWPGLVEKNGKPAN
jgi:YHS domain-containing protein